MDRNGKFLPPFGGDMQVAPYQPSFRKFANPGPLGLSAFALTTFVLSLLNLNTRGIHAPAVVVGLAYGYGGLVQLLAGMWEMASGNTFAATALSSYGGFWISWAIINTSAFGIPDAYSPAEFQDVLGFYLMGWFIFTFVLLLCTMKSTVAFFSLFLTLDLAFLFLALGHLIRPDMATGVTHSGLIKTGGVFGLLAAFLAWYNAYAGISEKANSFLQVHVVHFPWSETRRAEKRGSVSSQSV
ncbi:hypothetical protein BJ508DRAFT_214902 [Ascobolus immersus RN42]|uniref:GPR/FUN34 family protein n=1 Tax=Ascobolus immersus RN42 TaxID=1160509 RepID=A0A3N4HMC5_ASCIM|nr:hypothetical protein BJ508DRAFT_214902 [Ascobolus immersus RN42]